jgi:alpha-D-xyloside xylohydrolase
VAFGLLSSHSRLHGNHSYRVPWNFDDEACDVLRYFTRMKCQLMPYLYQAACDAATQGAPLMRAMALEFPDDPACAYLDRQYLLGHSLLVAPVFADQGPVDYYLPCGRWTDFFSGEVREGGRWFRDAQLDFFHLPLWVRENTVIPLGAEQTRPDYAYAEEITLCCYTPADGCEIAVRIPDLQGGEAARFLISRHGPHLTAQRQAGSASWSVKLMGINSVTDITGAVEEPQPTGVCLHADAGTNLVTVQGVR